MPVVVPDFYCYPGCLDCKRKIEEAKHKNVMEEKNKRNEEEMKKKKEELAEKSKKENRNLEEAKEELDIQMAMLNSIIEEIETSRRTMLENHQKLMAEKEQKSEQERKDHHKNYEDTTNKITYLSVFIDVGHSMAIEQISEQEENHRQNNIKIEMVRLRDELFKIRDKVKTYWRREDNNMPTRNMFVYFQHLLGNFGLQLGIMDRRIVEYNQQQIPELRDLINHIFTLRHFEFGTNDDDFKILTNQLIENSRGPIQRIQYCHPWASRAVNPVH